MASINMDQLKLDHIPSSCIDLIVHVLKCHHIHIDAGIDWPRPQATPTFIIINWQNCFFFC